MPILPLNEWTAEQLRLTAFSNAAAPESRVAWWRAAAGDEPEESTASPKKGAFQAAGDFGAGKLVLRMEPRRIDWLQLQIPVADDHASGDPFAGVGSWSEALVGFTAAVKRWLALEDLPEIDRLAFGSIIHHAVETRAEGYEKIGAYLPVVPDPSTSDFLYQINYPVESQSGVEGLRLNRLSKWSVAAIKSFNLSLSPTRPITTTERKAVFALRLELDVNTNPESQQSIPAARLGAVYDELVHHAMLLASEGLRQL